MLRPSHITIQALLLLVRMLQDDLQPDAAWTFLGITVRSAQTLGMHTILTPSVEDASKCVVSKRCTWYLYSDRD